MVITQTKEVSLDQVAEIMLHGEMLGIGNSKGELDAVIFIRKKDKNEG